MQGRPKPARAFTTTASEREREQAQRDQLRAQQARVETVEKYSGLRIKNRVVAGMVVEDRFADLRFYRLKDLRPAVTGRWATAGVLVEKSLKSSSNGGSYSVWKLSDLGRDDACISVFLFGQAHTDNWREPEGTIWSVVDAQLNESRGDRDGGRPSATVDGKDPRALWKLGTSADFGRCRGVRRDGNNCTMHVNRSLSEYCSYHASAALKAFTRSGRMNVGVRRAPKFTVNGKTVMGTRGGGNGGKTPSLPPGVHAAGYRAQHQHQRSQQQQQPARTYGDEERRAIAARHGLSSGSRGAAMLGGLAPRGNTAGAGARFAAAFAKLDDGKDPGKDPENIVLVDDGFDCDGDALRAMIKDMASAERAKAVAKALKPPDPNDWRRKPLGEVRVCVGGANAPASSSGAKAGAKGLTPGATRTTPGFEGRTRLEAQAGVEKNGPPETDPRGAKRRGDSQSTAKPPVPGSFGDVFGAVLDGQDDMKRSRYADDAEAMENERLMTAMDALEKQDKLYTQLTNTRSMKVTASKCVHPGCGAVYEQGRRPTRCFEERHQAKAIQAEKRWFKCASGNCQGRCVTLNKPFPPHKCHKCGCADWDRTGIPASAGAAGKGFEEEVANAKGMLARGVEHGFSLGGGGAVYDGGARHFESIIDG